jgi:hypothetical protein
MTYREIRQTNIEKTLDRDQWSELGRVEFQQLTFCINEHLSEPIYFGRAFDAPPFFSFSAVARFDLWSTDPLEENVVFTGKNLINYTIGVAEWIQDPQGMYVGARLWYKTQQFVP